MDPQIAALLAEDAARPPAADLAARRAAYVAVGRARAGAVPELARVRDDGSGPVPVRRYEPAGARGTVLFLHGGGWVLGDLDSHDGLCRHLAAASGAELVAADYRRAPEHRFPAAVEDAEAALRWLAAARGPIAVAGDSAGGGLAAVLARRAPELVRLHVLLYPVCDARPGPRAAGERDGLSWGAMADLLAAWRSRPDHPDVSPVLAPDLRGLPPAWVGVAEHDVLRPGAEAYVERLRAAGVPAMLRVWTGTAHGFLRWTGPVAAARAALGEAGAALRAALRD